MVHKKDIKILAQLVSVPADPSKSTNLFEPTEDLAQCIIKNGLGRPNPCSNVTI